ncbi:hypothetical protein DFR98_000339 [Clostridium saccharobutylicum]|nr:hypothetical protein [Clostridium saccharobutylicum]
MDYYVISVKFNYDNDGNIKSVSIPFEPNIKEILFKKEK